jgi:PPP family 3-phenylpropionic acid transporter
MSQMQLMRLFAPYLWGVLADRLAQRMLIIRLAAVLSLLGFSSFFAVSHFPAMLVAMAFLAFFWSAALPLLETVTFDHLRDDPARYSRIRLWGSIGFIVAVMGTGALLDSLPLPSLLWVIVGTLGGILIYALAVPEAKPHAAADEHLPVATILRQLRVRALFAACFAMSAAHGALYVFYSIHLSDHHYSKFLVGCLWSLGVLAEIVVFFFMGGLLRRFGLRKLLLASFSAAAVRFLMIGWCVEWLWVIVLAQLLHGLTFGAYHAAAIAAVNRWFAGRSQARGQALYSSLSFGAGGLVGSLLSGWTWDAWGAAPTFALSSAFALVGLLFVARWVRKSDLDEVVEPDALRLAGSLRR